MVLKHEAMYNQQERLEESNPHRLLCREQVLPKRKDILIEGIEE